MTPEEFHYIAELLRQRSGLVLTRDKSYLIENKLMPVIRRRRYQGMQELLDSIRRGDPSLTNEVVDAMMTLDTSFFRDWKPFEHFRQVTLPNVIRARESKKSFRILSCGTSTGQEAYSIALTLKGMSDSFAAWDHTIVAVDLVDAALARAKRGIYTQFEVQSGLPVRTLLANFSQVGDAQWKINDSLRAGIDFKKWNLIEDLFELGAFDIVFCRNVIKLFDKPTQKAVLGNLARLLADDGVLYLGADETAVGVSPSFTPIDATIGLYGVHRPDRPVLKNLAMSQAKPDFQSGEKALV